MKISEDIAKHLDGLAGVTSNEKLLNAVEHIIEHSDGQAATMIGMALSMPGAMEMVQRVGAMPTEFLDTEITAIATQLLRLRTDPPEHLEAAA